MLFLIMFIAVLATYFLPVWWAFMPVMFIIAFWGKGSGGRIFISGCLSTMLAWILLSLVKSIPNHNMLATKVARLFSLPHWMILLLFTGMIGGILGGLSALTGHSMRASWKSRSEREITTVIY